MERNVLPQARKFAELGVTNEQLESVDPIEALVRLPAGESNTDETQN